MKIRVCGLDFDDIGIKGAVREALSGGGKCFVATPNALMLEDCMRTPEHRNLLSCASLLLPDGSGVVRAAARIGTPFVHGRAAGIDFGEELLRVSALRGERVFLLGGADGVAEQARAALILRHPGLKVVGTYWGYFDRTGEENRNLLGILNAVRPTVLLVCLGYPLQEEWIIRNLPRLPSVRVAAGLGGSLDVWAGRVRRAPHWCRRTGLEWAWRMLCEPHRLENLPALLRFSRFCRSDRLRTDGNLHMETACRPQDLNKCYENDNFESKPL